MSFQKRNTTCFKKICFKKWPLPFYPSYPLQTEHILNHDGLPKDRTKTVLLGASLISSSTPVQAKGDHKVKPGEVYWPQWARARATSWWVRVSSLVWMGEEKEPRPVGDKVAGVATPPQGQYGLSHLFHWKHFLKEIVVQKKLRRGQDLCRNEQVTIDRARRYWKTMTDPNCNVFNLTPFD